MKMLFLCTLIMMPTLALAQSGPECLPASALAKFMLAKQQRTAGDYDRVIALFKNDCPQGETMTVPSQLAAIWHNQCDFNKPISIIGAEAVCIKRPILATEAPVDEKCSLAAAEANLMMTQARTRQIQNETAVMRGQKPPHGEIVRRDD